MDTLFIVVTLFPWIQSYSDDPWTLLRLAHSPDPRVRCLGVRALAQQHHWHGTPFSVSLDFTSFPLGEHLYFQVTDNHGITLSKASV